MSHGEDRSGGDPRAPGDLGIVDVSAQVGVLEMGQELAVLMVRTRQVPGGVKRGPRTRRPGRESFPSINFL